MMIPSQKPKMMKKKADHGAAAAAAAAAKAKVHLDWCEDQLHNLLGYSDRPLAQYLLSRSSTAEVLTVLQQAGGGGGNHTATTEHQAAQFAAESLKD
jgi:hypothetical protein